MGLVSCTSVDVPEPLPGPEPPAAGTTEQAPPDPPEGEPPDDGDQDGEDRCLGSLRPEGPASTNIAPDSYMTQIQERGVLRVGVDEGTPRFSNVDLGTGEPVGFDVDIAREVAGALLDDRDAVELVGMTTGERIDALLDGQVDMVVHNFTITCDRWEEIAFSTEYFRAYQRILVPRDNPARSLEDLAGQRVCASRGSTAIDHINDMSGPQPLVVTVPHRTDCLMLLQQGQIDALATDDAILAGMAAQDPSLRLRGEVFSEEPYGIGLPPSQPEWVRYVNAVLEEILDGSNVWQDLVDEWLSDIPGLNPEPPERSYKDRP